MSFPLLATEGDHGRREALRYRTLRQIADALVVHREPRDLFRDLAGRLKKALSFNFINFVLHDPTTNTMRLHGWETAAGAKALRTVRWTVDDTTAGWVWQRQRPLLIPDVQAESRFPRALETLREHHVRTYLVLPMSTGSCKLGTIGIGCGEPGAYGPHDLDFVQAVSHFVTAAVEKALRTQQAERERDRLRLLLGLSNSLVSNHTLEELFPAIASALRAVIQHDVTTLMLYNLPKDSMRLFGVDHSEAVLFTPPEGGDFPLRTALAAEVLTQAKPLVFHYRELVSRTDDQLLANALAQGIRSICLVPLTTSRGQLGTINLLSRREQSFDSSDLELLLEIGMQIGIALENATAFAEIAQLKERLAQEKLYLEDEIRTEHNFEHIVGSSRALKKVLAQVETVAASEATVLILGETGTGKELVARATHSLSNRRARTFVKLNCAAIPTGLLESELFGHEKGAFTGAVAQKLGRFELADQGTLFLDEVGEIPLEAQPKLLRALQDQEFERLGGTRTIRVNVRVVAATNRDLARMVADRQFRSDLFYRLNVFPIHVPPLRNRRGDIPILVRYFVQKFCERTGMRIETIPADTMKALVAWPWPGNVRELGNIIERAVILSRGSMLRVPLAELQATADPLSGHPQTLEGAERDHIRQALCDTQGLVAGPSGAAARLGLKRTTLLYKMEKLGITSHEFRNQRHLP